MALGDDLYDGLTAQDAAEAAAKRTRRAVAPPEGRLEGPLTQNVADPSAMLAARLAPSQASQEMWLRNPPLPFPGAPENEQTQASAEAAAARTQRAVRPPGGRQEGYATANPDLGMLVPRTPLDYAMYASMIPGVGIPASLAMLTAGMVLQPSEAQASGPSEMIRQLADKYIKGRMSGKAETGVGLKASQMVPATAEQAAAAANYVRSKAASTGEKLAEPIAGIGRKLVATETPGEGGVRRFTFSDNGKPIGDARMMGDTIGDIRVAENLRQQGYGEEIVRHLIEAGGRNAIAVTPESRALFSKFGTVDDAGRVGGLTMPATPPARRMTEVPDIRNLPRDEATAIARQEPHLIPAGEQSAGYYVGGPRTVVAPDDLAKVRAGVDAMIAAEPRGWDWYDRTGNYLNRVSGGDPEIALWKAKQHGQWSQGISPQNELQYVIKENNATLAGMPQRAYYDAQHQAHMKAVAANDPSFYQLGPKTGPYSRNINPFDETTGGATGVNDIWHARNYGYTDKSGKPQSGALGPAEHRFVDYETALTADRASAAGVGGKTDWTGAQIQAAGWVPKKAQELIADSKGRLTPEEAFTLANRTIDDYAPELAANATYEPQPGWVERGHMPLSPQASTADRLAYATHPLNDMTVSPTDPRDAIYGGLRHARTGVTMDVLPTVPMQGMWESPRGPEYNRGYVGQPLVMFNTGGKGQPFKQITPHDERLLNAGEGLRAILGGQDMGSWHKLWFGGPNREMQSLFYPKSGMSNPQEMMAAKQALTSPPLAAQGLPDIADMGRGITNTQWWPKPPDLQKGQKDQLGDALKKGAFKNVVPGSEPVRARVDSNAIDIGELANKGEGSGTVTDKLIELMNQTPEIRQAFNDNPHIARIALNKIQVDELFTPKWGAPSQDLTNLRKIISEGTGWIDRVEEARRKGIISLPAVAALLSAVAQEAGVTQPELEKGKM